MSDDPHSGIAFVTMFDSANGQLSNGEQFSAVEVAPDEFLTAAHAVTNSDGSLRNYGTVIAGYTGTKGSGYGMTVDGVHVFSNAHTTGVETVSTVGDDLALLHVSSTDPSGIAFKMATGVSGDATVSGYTANAEGSLVEQAGALTTGVTGELLGTALDVDGSAKGSSGGPVWTMQNGTPTVEAVVSAGSGSLGMFASLTTQDISTIDAWIYSDDAGKSWDSLYAPPPAPTPSPAPTPPTDPSSSRATPAVDRLTTLAGDLRDASAGASAPKGRMMNDVATGLTIAEGRGLSGSDIPDAAYGTAAILGNTSWTPKRSVAYMAGLMAAEAGVAKGRVLGYVANVFGLSLGGKAMNAVAMTGYADDQAFGANAASAPIPDQAADGWTAQGLAASLGSPAATAVSSDSTATARSDAGTTVVAAFERPHSTIAIG